MHLGRVAVYLYYSLSLSLCINHFLLPHPPLHGQHEKKTRKAQALRVFISASLTRLIHEQLRAELALASRLGLLLALDARFLVMFTFPYFCQCASLLAGTLESAESTVDRFVFSYFDLICHCSSPPPLDLGRTGRRAHKIIANTASCTLSLYMIFFSGSTINQAAIAWIVRPRDENADARRSVHPPRPY